MPSSWTSTGTMAALADLQPLIVYVHGGGWRQSHRTRSASRDTGLDRGFFARLTDAGFVVAAPDYRLSGEARYPAQLDDVTTVLAWLHDHSDDLGVDGDRTYVWGASAGGHLAALCGLSMRTPRRRPGSFAGTR